MNLPNINKKIVALIVSMIIGILSIWGFKKAFDSKIESMSKKGPEVAYVVASKDLVAGTILSSDIVSQRNISSDYSQSNAVLAGNFSSIEGAVLKFDLKPGDIIMYSMVDTKKDISKLIPLGRRAITIPVDDESSISTMLKPGDLLDLIITLQSSEKTATIPLMQGVKILATGKQTDIHSENLDTAGYTNITLDVSAEDAKNITLAASLGKISAILRNPDDQVISDTSGFMQLLNAQKRLVADSQPTSVNKEIVNTEPTPDIKDKRSNSSFNIIYGNKDE